MLKERCLIPVSVKSDKPEALCLHPNPGGITTIEVCPSLEKEPVPQSRITAIDIGSTSVKVEVWEYTNNQWSQKDLNQSQFNGSAEDRFWSDYRTEIFEYQGQKFRCLRGSDLENLLSMIRLVVNRQLQIQPKQKQILTLTGFTNSLALVHQGEMVVLLDEPSPTTEYQGKQEEIVTRYLGVEAAEKIPQAASSLTKYLFLVNNSGVLNELFGHRIDAKELEFSSMLGVLRQYILDLPFYSIPQTDLGGFGAQRVVRTSAMLSAFETDFKVPDFDAPQSFYDDQERDIRIDAITDFEAEVNVIKLLVAEGIIGPHASVTSTDSVGKIVGPGLNSYKEEGGVPYLSQRMTANVNKVWLKGLLGHRCPEGNNFYYMIDQFIQEMMDRIGQGPYYFFPVRNGNGCVYQAREDGWHKLSLSEAGDLPRSQREVAALAVISGAIFGLVQKTEAFYHQSQQDPSALYFYGGLTGFSGVAPQFGWRTLISGAMPRTAAIHRLKLPSAASAAAFLSLKNLGFDNGQLLEAFEVEVEPMPSQADLRQAYSLWLKKQKELVSKEKLAVDEWATIRANNSEE